MSPERDPDKLLMDHEYDGIQEYDNPMPRWWLASLWGTVIFSILYALNIAGIGSGKGRIAEYEADMAAAAAVAAAHDPMAGITAEKLLAAGDNEASRLLGQTTFTTLCASCHGPDGGGVIGPNLTDDFWIHGGKPLEIMRTIVEGVAAKGMPSWGKILKPDQLEAVAAYVIKLRGTTPANPKAPEGTPVQPDSAGAAGA